MTKPTAQPLHHLDRPTLDEYFLGEASVLDLLGRGVRHFARTEAPAQALSAQQALLGVAEAALRAEAEDVERERAELPGLLLGLEGVSSPGALAWVARDSRFHILWFAESLLSAGAKALERRDLHATHRLAELAEVALRGIDLARYGPLLLADAKGELLVLRAALALAQGELNEADALWNALRLSIRAGTVSDEVRGGFTLVRAGLCVARQEWGEARAALEAASLLCTGGGATRWEPWAEAGAAWLDRRSGHPEAAVARLTAYFEWGSRWPVGSPIELWPARELVLGLRALGQPEKAAEHVEHWAAEPDAEGLAAVELAYFSALLGAGGDGGEALERAYRNYLALEMGLAATAVALDLYQVQGASHGPRALELGTRLEEVALLDCVSADTVAALARFAYQPAADERGALEALQDRLTQARAGWGPALRHDES
jgi:hypothetical protein